ncbi:hypothetical protein V9T40_013272 [Parthenolecanium corni]|uniref:Uncharacterized protein n=1 Tax=Parthenolecanium corni TaxID=536013 RepID=A0AAN9TLJ0_9HEMI
MAGGKGEVSKIPDSSQKVWLSAPNSVGVLCVCGQNFKLLTALFVCPHPTPAPTLDLPNKVTDGSGDHADDDEDCHHTHSLNTVHPLRPQPPLRTIFAFNLAFKSELLNDMFGGGYYYGRLPFYRSEIFVSFVCIYKSMSSVAILFSISNFLLA